jgi:hypothetical protein
MEEAKSREKSKKQVKNEGTEDGKMTVMAF